MGTVDAHEHLFIASPAMRGGEIQDTARVLDEVRDGQATGLTAFVELTPIGLGRRPELMRQVAQETGAVIIGATGYHRDEHYPRVTGSTRRPRSCWPNGSWPTCATGCTPTTGRGMRPRTRRGPG